MMEHRSSLVVSVAAIFSCGYVVGVWRASRIQETKDRSSIQNTEKITKTENLSLVVDEILSYWFAKYDSIPLLQTKLWMIPSQQEKLRHETDVEIAERFRHVYDSLANVSCQRGKLALIIVLDQFTRHWHRLARVNEYWKNRLQLLPQEMYDRMAFGLAKSLDLTSCQFSIPMRIFALLPYRHQHKLETIQFVQDEIRNLETTAEETSNMIRRFRTATNRRMDVALQESVRTAANDMDDILECAPFPADRTKAKNHIVYRTMLDFLREHPSDELVISLSGGVDSMVIASVVVDLIQAREIQSKILVAVHIDYGNRAESKREADYVRSYCADTLKIECVVRRIDEITRGVTKRDDYERQSREIRYEMYKKVMKDPIVLLGHHKGDLRENVLSNIHKGCTVLNLSGMTSVSRQNGVTIWRPLLPLEKDSIFDYAHTYGIPYFKDTTPHWSTRGKLRNKLLPLLQDVYGEGCMMHLSQLAIESDECREFVFATIFLPFLDQVKQYPLGISFATGPWKDHGIFFWKAALREMLHSSGLGMFSDKTVAAFLERSCDPTKPIREGWLQCRRDYAVYLREDGRVFVFFPSTFPWHKKDQYELPPGRFGCNDVMTVGPWSIVVEQMPPNGADDNALLDKRAIASFDELMKGRIEYYVSVDADAGPAKSLVFCKTFSKANRPEGWKSTDLKIQETLPLLAPELGKGGDSPKALVKISLSATRETA